MAFTPYPLPLTPYPLPLSLFFLLFQGAHVDDAQVVNSRWWLKNTIIDTSTNVE